MCLRSSVQSHREGLLGCPGREQGQQNWAEEQAGGRRWGDQLCSLDFPGSTLGSEGEWQEPGGPRVTRSLFLRGRDRRRR